MEILAKIKQKLVRKGESKLPFALFWRTQTIINRYWFLTENISSEPELQYLEETVVDNRLFFVCCPAHFWGYSGMCEPEL